MFCYAPFITLHHFHHITSISSSYFLLRTFLIIMSFSLLHNFSFCFILLHHSYLILSSSASYVFFHLCLVMSVTSSLFCNIVFVLSHLLCRFRLVTLFFVLLCLFACFY